MRQNVEHRSSEFRIWFFPRRRTDPHIEVLNEGGLKRVRVAASHFRDPALARLFVKQARRGADIEVLAHDSLRRVPPRIERLLREGGVRFSRYRHEDGLPMHNKFMLLEGGNKVSVIFGSLNLTRTSRWLNHEILMKSDNRELFAAFATRWQDMQTELRIQSTAA